MIRRRHALALSIGPAAFVLGPLISASCTTASGPDPCRDGTILLMGCEPDDGGVIQDRFTDEACGGLDTAETRAAPTTSDAQAPAIDAPSEAQALPGATPFTFRWHPQGLALRAPLSPRPFRWQDDLARWTTLLPSAEAHCAPFGGLGYALIFAAEGQRVFRVETGRTDWTADPVAWRRLRAAHGAISLTIEAARFASNTVTEGPVISVTPRTFTILP